VQATANHPFLTYNGWQALEELSVGSRVAIPRSVPEPLNHKEMPRQEIIMLAHLLGDGSFVKGQPIRYASIDEENLRAVAAAAEHFGITPIPSVAIAVPADSRSTQPDRAMARLSRAVWSQES
jgi:replicative DNA helicase